MAASREKVAIVAGARTTFIGPMERSLVTPAH